MKNNTRIVYSIFLIIGDFLALVGSFSLAYIFRVSLDHRRITTPITALHYLETFLVIMPFFILLFALIGLYNSEIYDRRFKEFFRLIVGCFIGTLFVVSYGYLANHPIFPAKLVIFYGLLISVVIEMLFRNIARLIQKILRKFGYGLNNLMLLGYNRTSKELIDAIDKNNNLGYKLVAIVSNKQINKLPEQCQIFADLDSLIESKIEVDTIIQTELNLDNIKDINVLNYAQHNHIEYLFFPGNNDLFVGNLTTEIFNGIPLIEVHQTAIFGWGQVIKRLTDIVFSILLLVIFSPFFVIVPLIIRLSDDGPIFYHQDRLTRYNKVFKVYKFRTLKTEFNGLSPEQAFRKMSKPELINIFRKNGDFLVDDPRLYNFGRIMRKYSIDELPQILNVLKGDISLVGPRALVPEELNLYHKKHVILSIKSGLTGLAQISGRKDISYDERRKLDVYYVQNWSIGGDLVILLKTIWTVLSLKGSR